MSWIEDLKAKQVECEQHKAWLPYWKCLTFIRAASSVHQATGGTQDCFDEQLMNKHKLLVADAIVSEQFMLIEQLAQSNTVWQPPHEVEVEPGHSLPIGLALMLPYAKAINDNKKHMAKRGVLMIDTDRALSPANREMMRRVLFALCDYELADDQQLPTDACVFEHLTRQEDALKVARALSLKELNGECPDSPRVPKSQRQDFAQTRGPRPQHNAHFSKQSKRGRGPTMNRSRGRGR